MGLAKQAKVLSGYEQSVVKEHLQKMRHSKKDLVMFFLSVKAGLRAKEIANLTWEMVCTPAGELDDMIKLPNNASKGKYSGREIPITEKNKFSYNKFFGGNKEDGSRKFKELHDQLAEVNAKYGLERGDSVIYSICHETES